MRYHDAHWLTLDGHFLPAVVPVSMMKGCTKPSYILTKQGSVPKTDTLLTHYAPDWRIR